MTKKIQDFAMIMLAAVTLFAGVAGVANVAQAHTQMAQAEQAAEIARG